MPNSNKKRDAAKRRLKRKDKARKRERSVPSSVSVVNKLDIQREVKYITQRAQAEDSRLVEVGKLVLFSTRSRAAWVLDPEDDVAMCVCRDGEPQPLRILDAPNTFVIDWPAKFAIDGDAFIVLQRSGRQVEIYGYPTAEISAACRRVSPR